MLQYVGSRVGSYPMRVAPSKKYEKGVSVMLDRVQLKYEAKSITKNAKVSAYLFTLLYLVILRLLDAVDTMVSGIPITADLEVYFGAAAADLPEVVTWLSQPIIRVPALVAGFIGIVIGLVSLVLNAGYVVYAMNVRKGQTTPYATLFDGFVFAGKLILLNIVISVFVFLWSLLLFIPGIIATYRYRFAIYNLCDDPSVGVMEALRMSKAQTKGHKGQLFVLDLSFIGWNLLCALTLGILSIWIMPYIQQTDIGYFEAIKSMSGIGSRKLEEDGQFHTDDRFDSGRRDYDPER